MSANVFLDKKLKTDDGIVKDSESTGNGILQVLESYTFSFVKTNSVKKSFKVEKGQTFPGEKALYSTV